MHVDIIPNRKSRPAALLRETYRENGKVCHRTVLNISDLPTEDPDFREIVEEFVERLGERLQAMKRAASEGKAEQLRELAHWLKGAGGTAGFGALTEAARGLEEAAKTADRADMRRRVAEIASLAARIELPVNQPL